MFRAVFFFSLLFFFVAPAYAYDSVKFAETENAVALWIHQQREERLRYMHPSASHMAEIKVAAKKGDVAAQFELGERYGDGAGVKQDYIESANWHRKAADQGDTIAQLRLGTIYLASGLRDLDSLYTPVDESQSAARKWYHAGRLRTKQQDYAEALKWLRRAAEQGNTQAQKELGMMYSQGLGVKQDYAEGYFWENIGNIREWDASQRLIRKEASKHLTPEQLKAVDRRVDDWKCTGRGGVFSPSPNP